MYIFENLSNNQSDKPVSKTGVCGHGPRRSHALINELMGNHKLCEIFECCLGFIVWYKPVNDKDVADQRFYLTTV